MGAIRQFPIPETLRESDSSFDKFPRQIRQHLLTWWAICELDDSERISEFLDFVFTASETRDTRLVIQWSDSTFSEQSADLPDIFEPEEPPCSAGSTRFSCERNSI